MTTEGDTRTIETIKLPYSASFRIPPPDNAFKQSLAFRIVVLPGVLVLISGILILLLPGLKVLAFKLSLGGLAYILVIRGIFNAWTKAHHTVSVTLDQEALHFAVGRNNREETEKVPTDEIVYFRPRTVFVNKPFSFIHIVTWPFAFELVSIVDAYRKNREKFPVWHERQKGNVFTYVNGSAKPLMAIHAAKAFALAFDKPLVSGDDRIGILRRPSTLDTTLLSALAQKDFAANEDVLTKEPPSIFYNWPDYTEIRLSKAGFFTSAIKVALAVLVFWQVAAVSVNQIGQGDDLRSSINMSMIIFFTGIAAFRFVASTIYPPRVYFFDDYMQVIDYDRLVSVLPKKTEFKIDELEFVSVGSSTARLRPGLAFELPSQWVQIASGHSLEHLDWARHKIFEVLRDRVMESGRTIQPE